MLLSHAQLRKLNAHSPHPLSFILSSSGVSFCFVSADRRARALAAWCGGVNIVVVASQVLTVEKSSVLYGAFFSHILISGVVALAFSKRMGVVALATSGRCAVSLGVDVLNVETSKSPMIRK